METVTAAVLNYTITPVFEDYKTPEWRKYIWFCLYWLIAFTGTIGNSVVIWIVLAHKNMRTVTNFFLLNLAVVDGLLCSLNVPFVSFQLLFSYWPFGHMLCVWNEFMAATSICVTVFTLSMIAIDRYVAVMYPFKLRMGRGKTITILILLWVLSIIVTSPNWIYITTIPFDNKIVCTQIWPSNSPETMYRISFMIFTYFLPLLCMTFSYGRMGSVLWKSKRIGEKSVNQAKIDLAKQKIVKMMIMMVIIFTVCWLPFHIMFILHSAGLLTNNEIVDEIYTGAFWFAMSNSMYNPMVYCWMNARFRAGFKKAFRWCPCISYDVALDAVHFSKTGGDQSIAKEAV